MKLSDLYQSLDQAARKSLAEKASVDPGYLWQIATQWRGKKPSVDVIGRLVKADRRLKASDLISEFSDASPEPKEPAHA